MATRADFSDEQWAVLGQAPFAAGMYVVMASPSGPIGVVQEMTAMAMSVRDAATAQGDHQLVTLVAQELLGKEGRSIAEPSATERAGLLEIVKQAAVALEQATDAEAEAFRGWINRVAERAAGAASEGGFFGLGKERVSEAEQAAIAEVKAAIEGTAAA
jgi:hypothetical protein